MLYNATLLFTMITLSIQHNVILIKGIPGCPPTRICEINGLDDVVANANNVNFLRTMLYNNGIEAAAVGGWNDHISYDMVLRSNGALAPYRPDTNNACYAFCIKSGEGCNRKAHCANKPTPVQSKCRVPIYEHRTFAKPSCNVQVTPAKQHHVAYPPQKEECEVSPKPCPSSSSSSSESCSSSSSESYSDNCDKYVKQKKLVYRNKNRRDRCKDTVRAALEKIKIVKTFVFKSSDMKCRDKVKFCEVTNKATDLIKWVELGSKFNAGTLVKDGYPTLLRFPVFLLELKEYIACKYEYRNVCLYLDCSGNLYVRIRDTLFQVKFRKGLKMSTRRGFKHIKLCPIKGKKLDCLIQKGLASVVFEERRSDC